MSLADTVKSRLSDALGTTVGWFADLAIESMEKASQTRQDGLQDLPKGLPEPASQPDIKGLTWDPYSIVSNLGYKDRPISLTYDTLDLMSKRVPIFGCIVHNRVHQVASFAYPQENDLEPGFTIKLRDEKKSPTKAEKKEADGLANWLQFSGSTRKKGKDNFETFLKKIARDSLIYDQQGFEIIRNRKGQPSDFIAHDARTLRIADVPPGVHLAEEKKDEIRYVQVYDEVVIAEFTADDLCFGIRNPRTDLRVNGYGYSELEMIISTITALLYGFDYNLRFFTQGSQPKGLLNIKGQGIPDSKIEALRRHWHAMATGAHRAWRMPIMTAEDVQYISFQQTNRDMEFSSYMDFLIKITCSIMLTDPAELNFVYGNTGQTSQMFSTHAENKIQASKDRGLRPILRSLAWWINEHLVWELNEDFQLVFTGMDAKSADDVVDMKKKQVTFLKTVDEIRAEDDLPPLPDKKGEVILDSTWLQNAQAIDAAAQQQMQGGQEGEEGGQPMEGDAGAMQGQDQGQEGDQVQQEQQPQQQAQPQDFSQEQQQEY